MNPHKLEKWNRWLGDVNSDGTIVHELSNLALIREIHSGLREMVDNNKNLQKYSAFYSVVQMTYSQSALMYIRRQVRCNDDSVSLINLAQEILENCDMFTKAFYSGLYTQGKPYEEYEVWKRLGESDFSKYFGGRAGSSLDPAIIKVDVQNLERIFHDSSEFIDKRLAHLDKKEINRVPIYTEIGSWCQVLNDILKKYMLLLRAVDFQIEPILEHDWKSIFRAAWL